MRTLVKILIALGLVLPLGAYVAGSMAAVGGDDPRPHDTIVIRDSPTRSPSPSPDLGPSPSGRPSQDDHGGPEVVTPSLHDLGDDHGGDRGGSGGSGGHGSDGGGGSSGGHGSDDSGGGGHG